MKLFLVCLLASLLLWVYAYPTEKDDTSLYQLIKVMFERQLDVLRSKKASEDTDQRQNPNNLFEGKRAKEKAAKDDHHSPSKSDKSKEKPVSQEDGSPEDSSTTFPSETTEESIVPDKREDHENSFNRKRDKSKSQNGGIPFSQIGPWATAKAAKARATVEFPNDMTTPGGKKRNEPIRRANSPREKSDRRASRSGSLIGARLDSEKLRQWDK